MKSRISGYDLIRTFAILTVFIGHIINYEGKNETVLLISRATSPGLPMSLLGFISGALLSNNYKGYIDPDFYIKRLSRIFIPLFLCLSVLSVYLTFLGMNVITEHSIIHYMGLSGFFELFQTKSVSALGGGLWFVTIILIMYLLFPFLGRLLSHTNGFYHLIFLIIILEFLAFRLSWNGSVWNVMISFAAGIYMGVNNRLNTLEDPKYLLPAITASFIILVFCALSTLHIFPYWMRTLLYPAYPFCFVPFFFAISRLLPKIILVPIKFFASVSYEFYILHGYIINSYFRQLFPSINDMWLQAMLSFFITLTISVPLARLASAIRDLALAYLTKGQKSIFPSAA